MEASLVIRDVPASGLTAPPTYRELADMGLRWLKRGRYWIAYDPAVPIIAGVFFETDDIGNKARQD